MFLLQNKCLKVKLKMFYFEFSDILNKKETQGTSLFNCFRS